VSVLESKLLPSGATLNVSKPLLPNWKMGMSLTELF
jgi:hypothetical protein